MIMDTATLQNLIQEIKMDVVPSASPSTYAHDPMRISLADSYEILNLDKLAVKKLKEEEIGALIAYGQGYLEQYKEGKFLYKKGLVDKQGRVWPLQGREDLADYDEAEAFNAMVRSVNLLKTELNHKI
jgi:hypothetical protein